MSKKSIAEIFKGYHRRLLKFIRSRVGCLEDAEDILQDVFCQFARANNMINPIENTAAWLYRAARNKIIDHQRKKKDQPLPAHYEEDDDGCIFDEIADIIYKEKITPETEMLRSLFFEEIQTALLDLPAAQCEVFEMTELLNFSVKETAEKTHTPVNTVLSRKHYAVKFLRKRLKELYGEVMALSEKGPS
ncbi:MAG: sigma-70 family RNA polymerase sigma factor [Treponema sp.]|jgi:RNA polymerase sigma factor (sigma-70 family)|nr:sigma-70 family RNA polymerase sigma factor [Treponema sp.]